VGVLRGVGWWHFGGGGGVVEHIMQVVQMGDQVLPESHLGGPVMVTYPWL